MQYVILVVICLVAIVFGSTEFVDVFRIARVIFDKFKLCLICSSYIEAFVSECFALFGCSQEFGVLIDIPSCPVTIVEFIVKHVCKICLFSCFGCIC